MKNETNSQKTNHSRGVLMWSQPVSGIQVPPGTPDELRFRSGSFELYAKYYTRAGNRNTILLLSGLGFHTFEYETLAPLLVEGGYDCLSLDYRSHGNSDGPRGSWTLNDLVNDAKAAFSVLSERCTGNIGVFGNSLGAIVAVLMAADEPRVRSVVASGCPTRTADFAMTPMRRILLMLLDAITRFVPFRLSVNLFIPYRLIIKDSAIIRRIQSDPRISNARRFTTETYKDIFQWNALEAAARLNSPILVLQAKRDQLQPASQSQMLFDAIHCEKALEFIDSSHVPNLDNPHLLAEIVLRWFDSSLRAQQP
jgi:pimeloyl-ACP methyl ester carboxylesterase